ncbi:hypothetical protein MRX96_057048 [Rhipicephalus microplus]
MASTSLTAPELARAAYMAHMLEKERRIQGMCQRELQRMELSISLQRLAHCVYLRLCEWVFLQGRIL